MRTALLAWRELRVAGVAAVIHIIVDIVKARRPRAAVGRLRWASDGLRGLHRSIAETVTLAAAAVALEGVEETKPVTSLVNGGAAHVVVGEVAPRHCAASEHATCYSVSKLGKDPAHSLVVVLGNEAARARTLSMRRAEAPHSDVLDAYPTGLSYPGPTSPWSALLRMEMNSPSSVSKF